SVLLGASAVSLRSSKPHVTHAEAMRNFSLRKCPLELKAYGAPEEIRTPDVAATNANARDSAIAFSFAVPHGADLEAIRRPLCCDSQGRAREPFGTAPDLLLGSGTA